MGNYIPGSRSVHPTRFTDEIRPPPFDRPPRITLPAASVLAIRVSRVKPGWKSRWLESITQNLVASLIFIGFLALWGAATAFLLSEGGNRLTVRVWWLAVALAVVVVIFAWTSWLTWRVHGLATELADASAAPVAPLSHPHGELLDRMDAFIEHVSGPYMEDEMSWTLGEAYNQLLADAIAVSPTINSHRLPKATHAESVNGYQVTDQSKSDLVGALKLARVTVNRTKT